MSGFKSEDNIYYILLNIIYIFVNLYIFFIQSPVGYVNDNFKTFFVQKLIQFKET